MPPKREASSPPADERVVKRTRDAGNAAIVTDKDGETATSAGGGRVAAATEPSDSGQETVAKRPSTARGSPAENISPPTDAPPSESTSSPTPEDGASGLVFTKEQIFATVTSLHNENQQLKVQVAHLQGGSSTDKKRVFQLEGDVACLTEEASAGKKRESELEEEVARLELESSADKKRVSELEGEVGSLWEEISEADMQVSDLYKVLGGAVKMISQWPVRRPRVFQKAGTQTDAVKPEPELTS